MWESPGLDPESELHVECVGGGGELYTTGAHTEIRIFYLSIRRFCLQTDVDIVDI